MIRNNPEKLATIRMRLSDIAWWMRLLCQHIAVRANKEDGEIGKFFQSRYRAVRLMDDSAILACAAYVDLNPIRAAMAQTLETSDFTSIQRRIEALKADAAAPAANENTGAQTTAETNVPGHSTAGQTTSDKKQEGASSRKADDLLAPLSLESKGGELGAVLSPSGHRASDKGFLPMPLGDYIVLLDWTARRLVKTKRGATPRAVAPILERLGLDAKTWCSLVSDFGRLFYNVAGRPQTIDASTSRVSQHRYNVPSRARELFAPTQA